MLTGRSTARKPTQRRMSSQSQTARFCKVSLSQVCGVDIGVKWKSVTSQRLTPDLSEHCFGEMLKAVAGDGGPALQVALDGDTLLHLPILS